MRRRFTGRRPQILALGTIAVGGLTLSGCSEDVPQEMVFNTPDQCVQAGFAQDICNAEYQEALQLHLRDAPRFDGLAACEAQFGAGQCFEAKNPQAEGGGIGSFFVPFMTGYVVSSLIRDFTSYNDYRNYRSRTTYVPTPIYRRSNGDTVTSVITNGQRQSRPYNVNTRTVSRQGFGGRSSGGFFGG